MVVGTELLRHLGSVTELAVAILREAHRECLDGGIVAAHQRNDSGRIDPAGQERTEWHIAYHLQFDSLVQAGQEVVDGIGLRLLEWTQTAIRSRPVALLPELPAFPDS